MQSIVRKAVRPFMVVLKGIILSLIICAAGGAWAAAKPLAVWNGDFPTTSSGTSTHGTYTLSVNGNTPEADGSKITLASSSSGGVKIAGTSGIASTTGYSAIIRYNNVSYSSSAVRLLAVPYFNDAYSEQPSIGLNTDGKIKGFNANCGYYSKVDNTWPDTSAHWFAIKHQVNTSVGTVAYIDGVDKYNHDGLRWDAEKAIYGVTVGGFSNKADNNVVGAEVSFVAFFSGPVDADTISAYSTNALTSAYAPATEMTLSASDNDTLVSQGINLPVGGYITISGEVKVAAVFAQGDSEIRFADANSSLTISGPLYVADNNTLTVTPATLTTSGTKTLITASVIGSASNLSVTPPTESGYTYTASVGDTAVTLTRKPVPSKTYSAAIGSWTASGWGNFAGGTSVEKVRVGPNASASTVFEISSGFCPYVGFQAPSSSSWSFSVYADVSKASNSTTSRPILACFGSNNSSDTLLLYREGDYVKLRRQKNGDAVAGWAASVPVADGFHLWTFACDPTTGTVTLYDDAGNASSNTGDSSYLLGEMSLPAGFQLGKIYGNNLSGFTTGEGIAVASFQYYDTYITADDVAMLAAQYPATDGTAIYGQVDNLGAWNNHRTENNTMGSSLTVYSGAYPGDTTTDKWTYLGISQGTLTIPAGNTVSVPFFKTNNKSSAGNVTVDIAGTLNVTSTADSDIYSANKGILFGHYRGTGTYDITGELIGRSTYLMGCFSAGDQTINVNGGLLAVKGFSMRDGDGGNATVNLTNNGTVEVAAAQTLGNKDVIRNFGYGTYKVVADVTDSKAITFTGTAEHPTTLDPAGNTLTLNSAAMGGTGYMTVADSVGGGSVVFVGSSTATLILTDANAESIDISGYTGKVLYQGTAATLAKLNGFAGTVYFTSTVDASAIDLSRATVNVADDCTYTATAGNEGTMVLGSGAVATLNVTTDIVNYEGHVPSVSGSGSVAYYNTDTSAAVTGDDYINGNNLLPYYYVWEASETASENTLSANAAARWKGGVLPATGKNVAFKISGNTTLLVDATVSYGDIQVYGTGTLVFQASDGGVLTVADKLQTTSTTAVQIDSGLAFDTGASLEAVSTLPAYMTAVNCGTSETPFAIPSIVGAGTVYVAEGKVLSLGGADMGTLMALGEISLSGDATVSSLSVFDTGSMTLSGATLTVATTASIEGEVALDSTSHLLVTTSISGAGRVEYTGALPDGSLWATGTATTGWRGTVAIKSYSSSGSNPWYIANYGNANSFLEVDGCTAYYTVASSSGPTLVLVGDGLKIANGNGNDVTTYAGISGSATLTAQGAPTHAYKFGTASGFTGSINNNGRRIIFGSSTPDKDTQSKSITIDSGIEATLGDGATWTSEKIYLNGTLNVAGSGTLVGAVTAAGSAKIVLSSAPLAISGTLTATALEIDTGAISLSTTPTPIITGLTAEPDVAGITVENCNVTTGQADGKYVVYAAYKDTAWSGESGDWTESSFNGGTLATDGEDISFVAGANGAVAVTLTGTRAPANVVFNGGATSTYTLTGGTFQPTGTVTVESGTVTIESAATGTYVVKDGATLSLTNATVTSVSGAGTLNIPAGGVVTLASATALDSLAYITGEGELHVGANIPATTLNALLKKSYTENAETVYYWNGTVVIEGFEQTDDSSVGGTTLDCGNASSTIQLKNCTIRYFNTGMSTAAALEIVGTVTTLNGGSDTSASFGALKGAGTFVSSANNTVTHLYRFESSPEFAGSLSINGRRVVFGSEGVANDATDKRTYKGTIRVSADATASLGANASWVAYYGIYINGTLVVNGANGYITSNPAENKVVFANGATIKFNSSSAFKIGEEGTLTPTVASGSTVNIAFGDGVVLGTEPGTEMQLISWGGAPEGDFEFADVSTPKCYRLEKRENGLYLVVKPGTIFSVY